MDRDFAAAWMAGAPTGGTPPQRRPARAPEGREATVARPGASQRQGANSAVGPSLAVGKCGNLSGRLVHEFRKAIHASRVLVEHIADDTRGDCIPLSSRPPPPIIREGRRDMERIIGMKSFREENKALRETIQRFQIQMDAKEDRMERGLRRTSHKTSLLVGEPPEGHRTLSQRNADPTWWPEGMEEKDEIPPPTPRNRGVVRTSPHRQSQRKKSFRSPRGKFRGSSGASRLP